MFNGKIKMKKEVSQFWQRDHYPYEPGALLFYLIFAIGHIFLFGYMHIDDIFSMLFLMILGITVSLPATKWTIQNIEICLKEGKPLSSKNVRAAKYGKKSVNYLFIIFGLYLTIFALGLLFPELYLGDISVPYEMSPLLRSLRTHTPFMRAFGTSMFYLMGVLIGVFMPIYLRVRKLPKWTAEIVRSY